MANVNADKIQRFVLWTGIFALTAWILTTYVLKELPVRQIWAQYFIIGAGLTIIAIVLRSFLYKKSVNLNWGILYWIFVNTFSFWASTTILSNFQDVNIWLKFVLIGSGITIVGEIAKNVKIGNRNFSLTQTPWWAIIILIIIGFFVLNNVYTTYSTEKLTSFNKQCSNGTIQLDNNMMGFGNMAYEMEAGLACLEYKSSICHPSCQNNQFICECRATILDQLLYKPGEWLIGFFG